MLKKVIKYTDYNGQEREEIFYFNLSKAELSEMELSYPGGFSTHLQTILAQWNQPEIIKVFKQLIEKSYGIKTGDGKFMKSEHIWNNFLSSEAYSELFMALITDEDEASAFFNAVLPTIPEPKKNPPVS